MNRLNGVSASCEESINGQPLMENPVSVTGLGRVGMQYNDMRLLSPK